MVNAHLLYNMAVTVVDRNNNSNKYFKKSHLVRSTFTSSEIKNFIAKNDLKAENIFSLMGEQMK